MAISFTAAATGAALAALAQRGHGLGVRLSASHSTTCTGLSYALEFADSLNDRDVSFMLDEGLRLIVDIAHLAFFEGVTVDYVRQADGEGFQIASPPPSCDTCHCN